jgi:hypothetical protein
MDKAETPVPRSTGIAVAIAGLVLVALIGASVVALSAWSKRPPPRKTRIVQDQSGRLLEVTAPIDSSEVDAEITGRSLRFHAGPLAACKELPIGERFEVRADSTVVFTSSDGASRTFVPSGSGTFTALGSDGWTLSQTGGKYSLVEPGGRKHAFSQGSPFPSTMELPDGSRLFLTFKPEGWLIRIQASTRGAYSFVWTPAGKVEQVLDETSGTLWEYSYDTDGAVKMISMSRPVRDTH